MRSSYMAAVCSVLLASCSTEKLPSAFCTDIAIPGIAVTVEDATTGAPIASSTTVVARSASYTDSTTRNASPSSLDLLPIALAYEHEGTYTVTVAKPGYSGWMRSSVVVTADQCHVHTVKLVALLQRSP